MLVPLICLNALVPLPATRRAGYVVARYDPCASSDTILLPGATTSGFSSMSYRVGPREL